MPKKRPESHVINADADKQFRAALPSELLIIRRQEEDYGVDYELEVVQEGRVTGIVFKVQLKGTQNLTYSQDGSSASFPMDMDALTYLCEDLKVPSIIVVADVAQRKVFWFSPVSNWEFQKKFEAAKDKGQKSLTLSIPTANGLSSSVNNLLEEIRHLQKILATKVILGTPAPDFSKAYSKLIDADIDRLIKDFQEKAKALTIDKLDRLVKADKLEEAQALIEEIKAGQDYDARDKFIAILYEEKVLIRLAELEHNAVIEIHGRISQQLLQVVSNGPEDFQIFAQIARASFKIEQLVVRDQKLFIAWKMHENDDPVYRLVLYEPRRKIFDQIWDKFKGSLDLLNLILQKRYFYLLPQALSRVLTAIVPFALRLRGEGMDEAADRYRDILFSVIKIAADSAIKLRHWDDVALCCNQAIPLFFKAEDRSTMEPIYKWAVEQANRIDEPDEKTRILNSLTGTYEKMLGGPPETPPTFDWLSGVYEQETYVWRVDLSNPDDPVAQLVKLGLNDLDPTRVLKNCKHLRIRFGASGLPAETLRLPTAGSKILICSLHGGGAEGYDLDSVWAIFNLKYCSPCLDAEPCPDGWQCPVDWFSNPNPDISLRTFPELTGSPIIFL